MEGLGLGLSLVLIGLVFVLLVWFLLRLFPRNQANAHVPLSAFETPDASELKDAVIIVQGGGRLEYLNASARQLFGLREAEQIDLERLIRFTRPSNDFLSLFSTECQKRISIGSQLTEATSYHIPGLSPSMLVTFRNLDISPELSMGDGQASASILRVVADFGQAVSASLDLEATLQAVLENIGRLVSADVLEIKVWDDANQSLVPYHYDGRSSEHRAVRRVARSYFGDYSDSLLKQHKPLFLSRIEPRNDDAVNEITEPYLVR